MVINRNNQKDINMKVPANKYIKRDTLLALISKNREYTFTSTNDKDLQKELEVLAAEVLVSKNNHYPTVYLFLGIDGQDYILSGDTVEGEAVTVKDCFSRTCDEYSSKNNLTICERFALEQINTRKYTTPNWDKAFVLNEYGLAEHLDYTVSHNNQ